MFAALLSDIHAQSVFEHIAIRAPGGQLAQLGRFVGETLELVGREESAVGDARPLVFRVDDAPHAGPESLSDGVEKDGEGRAHPPRWIGRFSIRSDSLPESRREPVRYRRPNSYSPIHPISFRHSSKSFSPCRLQHLMQDSDDSDF
jgi:hypothetical protein